MLVYDELVPKGVLHERMRFDSTTFLVEFINNNIRMSNYSEMKARTVAAAVPVWPSRSTTSTTW